MPMPTHARAPGPESEADAAALRRLRWRARRGLLENDIVLGRYFERHGAALSPSACAALAQLLELPDGALLDLVLGRAALPAALDGAPVRALLDQLRAV